MEKSIPKTKSMMVQGTASHAGKSVLVAAICRILRRKGVKVAPFKAQNMALNSFVTKEGHEIGRSQALQAEACGIEPEADMNPVLLKPTGDRTTQVIIHGRVHSNMGAQGYFKFKREARRYIIESYTRLARDFEAIIIEGAGSPAEVNLRDFDIVNMGVAELTGSPVVIVGDIDRGGVFASLVGTMELLNEDERKRVKGFIINKFRGDIELLRPGIKFIEKRTGVPVLGVIPYMDLGLLPEEDGVSLEREDGEAGDTTGVDIAVVRLPRISNFTDFDPFAVEYDVRLRYIKHAAQINGADLVIIPGSKNTIEDLKWLRKNSFHHAIKRHLDRGGMVAGICGGLQMLGTAVRDPHGVESGCRESAGLGLVRMETTLEREKRTFQVSAIIEGFLNGPHRVEGYEIHSGESRGKLKPFSRIIRRNSRDTDIKDGCVNGTCSLWGTYIHGLFDNDGFRCALLNELRRRKGLKERDGALNFRERRERAIDLLADTVERSMGTKKIFEIMGIFY